MSGASLNPRGKGSPSDCPMAKTSPNELTVTEAAEAIRQGRLSAAEWCRACIAHAERIEPGLHAWVHWDPEVALRQARAVDDQIAAGSFQGRLWGAPVGIKDVINTADFPTWMGSPIWEGFTPGNDARIVAHLKWEGGVIPGKTVTAEFAVHHPGPTVNPHNHAYSPGTSSSGSAVAVATGMVPLAVGTQTAGSTIRPASYCGVYGFKPSFGVIPRTGILKTLDTLDHVSFFARSPEDLALIFESGRVRGLNHPYIHEHIDSWTPEMLSLPARVALVRGPGWEHAEGYARDAILSMAQDWAQDTDVHLQEVELPAVFREAHATHEVVYTKALSYYFDDEYEKHRGKLSEVFRGMVEQGRRITTDQYWAALERQKMFGKTLGDFLKDYDFILNLSTSGHAPKGLFGRDKKDNCLIWTLCHAPAINLPVFRSPDGLPFGAQLVARRYEDRSLFHFIGLMRGKGRIPDWREGKAVASGISQAAQ